MQNPIASLAQQFGLRPEQIQAGVGAIEKVLEQVPGLGGLGGVPRGPSFKRGG